MHGTNLLACNDSWSIYVITHRKQRQHAVSAGIHERTIVIRNRLRRALQLCGDTVAGDVLEELAVAGVNEG